MGSADPILDLTQANILSEIVLSDVAGNRYSLKPVEGQGLSVYKGGVNQGFSGLRKIAAKTAAYSILAKDIGTLFTNRGATGSVTLTLPATSTIAAGWWCRVFAAADYAFITASATADTITTFNDAAADSLEFSTASEILGSGAEFVWDGTKWLAFLNVNETQTPVINT